MVRIAPVSLSFNPKTLWFDAGDLPLKEGQFVVVSTARGQEFGQVSGALFDMAYEDTKQLKSPLKPVVRLAAAEDKRRNAEVADLSRAALPVFRRLAQETVPEMNPIAVEYLFDNANKAIFYFDADGHVDFRSLIKKLAAELSVRVDMRQIGVRDGTRMVGGLGHCGQEICCRRLGGQFNPVSIRMAKEQDLSLNPQKISGLCGRLLCCLRYEFDAYKDFHSRAPKKNSIIETPDGAGEVVDLDVPRETISIKVGDEKPVWVPLSEMDVPENGGRPRAVSQEAWDKANEPKPLALEGILHFFGSSQLEGSDKLAEPGKVTHLPQSSRKRTERTSADVSASKQPRKRRTHKSAAQSQGAKDKDTRADTRTDARTDARAGAGAGASTDAHAHTHAARLRKSQASSAPIQRKQRRRSTTLGAAHAQSSAAVQSTTSKVGRNSSGLRATKARHSDGAGEGSDSSTSNGAHKGTSNGASSGASDAKPRAPKES